MQFELISAAPGAVAKLRVVLMPGANQLPEDFRAAGFLAAMRDRDLDVDLVLVALELASVTDRSPLAQLHSEVVLPSRAAGCDAVWLAGLSLGAFLALLYAADHPKELDGIGLLAPYLGNRMIDAEIDRFPSLAIWSARMGDAPGLLAEERRVWRYIAAQLPQPSPVHYLGYGRSDRFAATQRLLASHLPPGNVDVIEGGHDWSTWRRLWDRFLERLAGAPPEFK